SPLIEDLDRPRVQAPCARAGQILSLAPLDEGDVHPRQRELARQHEPRRTSSGDDNRMLRHCRPAYAFVVTFSISSRRLRRLSIRTQRLRQALRRWQKPDLIGRAPAAADRKQRGPVFRTGPLEQDIRMIVYARESRLVRSPPLSPVAASGRVNEIQAVRARRRNRSRQPQTVARRRRAKCQTPRTT